MMDLLRLALALTGAAAAPPPRRSLVATGFAVAALGFAGLAVIAAVATSAAALWIGVRPLVGPVGAPLVVAAALLVLALIALGLAHRATRPVPAALPAPSAPSGANDAVLARAALAEATRLVVAHKVPVLLVALLAGWQAGTRAK